MLELFIELTDHVFWDGYTQQLSTENPAAFKFRFNEFINSYNQQQSSRALMRRSVSLNHSKKLQP